MNLRLLQVAAQAAAMLSAVTCAAQTDEAAPASSSIFSRIADTYRISGVLRGDYFAASKSGNGARDISGGTLQVKALPRLAENLEGKVEVRATALNWNGGASQTAEVIEGYATLRFDKADLRIGKQIIAWGRADGINPTDNLSPRDFTVLLPFEDDQRLGLSAAKLDYYLSPSYTLSVVTTPFFSPSTIPLPGNPTISLVSSKPQANLSNTELGVRLNQVGEGTDWSLSVFHGFNQLPSLQAIAGDPARSAIQLHYPRLTVLGADFAKNFGRYGVRAEVAYGKTSVKPDTDIGFKRPYLYWVAGLDRTFGENLNFNLQFFQRRVFNYRDPESMASPEDRALAVQSSVINGQRDRISGGITLRVSNKWFNDTLELEVFAVLNTTRHDRFIRPLATYAISDHWKSTVGAELYAGPPDTQFGALKPSRGAFAELRFGF